MSVSPWVISGLLLASSLAMGVLAVRVATRNTTSPHAEVKFFVLFTLLAGLWSLSSCLELINSGLTAKIFWAKVQYISIVFLPPIWLLFVVHYTDTFRQLRRWFYLFFIPSGLTLLVVWTNEWHQLMWKAIWLGPGPLPVAVFQRGPWFQNVLIPYSYLLLLSALGVLFTALWLSQKAQRGEFWLLLGAQLVPVLANFLYLVRLAPFDITPLGFAASSMLLGFGLFRGRLMQQLPIAYRHVFEQMRDGVLVLDSDRRLLNYNREAGRLLALTQEHLNHTLDEIHPSLAPMFTELWERRRHECQRGNVALEFHLRDMTMHGVVQGYILTVEDTTERKIQQGVLEQQARELELLDRVRVAVASQLSLSEVMHVSVEAVADVFGYKLVSVYLLEGDTLVMQHQVGYDTFIEHIPVSRGVMGRVARTAQPALVTNPKDESDFFEAVGGIISEVAVPLMSGGRVVGVFNLESTEDIFTESDLQLMMALSEQIAIAVERARLYEDVSHNEKQLRLLTENMSDLICLHALDATFTYVSPSSKTLFGYEPHELLGKSPFDYVHPDDLEYVKSQTKQLLEGKTPKPYLQRCRKKDGSYIWVEMFNQPVFDALGQMTSVVAVSRDVTERRRMEEQLLEGALLYDALTGLPNRVLFMDRLQQASRRSQRSLTTFAVMFLDLDRFKIINDSLGHRAGDTLLVEVAQRIGSCIRAGDTAARLGGDEFAILLEAIDDEAEVKQLAERIQQSLQLPFTVEGHEVVSSASIGIILRRDAIDPEDLLRRADMAMYQSKTKGKARYTIFDEAMHAHLQEQLRLENDLRKALAKNEFEVFYQPIIKFVGQILVGFEALVRWQHPERGLLLPASFITVAEDIGLIGEIDLWVLREACKQLKYWQRDSAALTMNVNVSARSLLLPNFSERLAGILKETNVEAGRVKLELTESVLMDHVASKELLSGLREQGFGLVIDDFGTGYSSLSYLHTLPLDALKIDRSFVQEMNASNIQIVSTIILLTQNLGLDVVAEGIETQEQLRQLQELGCEVGQGFLFGEGVSAGQVFVKEQVALRS